MTYKDLKIPVCGNSFKVFRNWKIFDWCTGRIIECNQLIKVADNKKPVISVVAIIWFFQQIIIHVLAQRLFQDLNSLLIVQLTN
ncbi:MAG: hypothetical protein U0T81_14160 [Saprospiraceae bacterium]